MSAYDIFYINLWNLIHNRVITFIKENIYQAVIIALNEFNLNCIVFACRLNKNFIFHNLPIVIKQNLAPATDPDRT